jgi:hypothetical protein
MLTRSRTFVDFPGGTGAERRDCGGVEARHESPVVGAR